jgi:carbon starvation protein CstA
MIGDITGEGVGSCVTAEGGSINIKGDMHSELGHAVVIVNNVIGYFDGNFSTNSQTATSTVFRIKDNVSGKISIKGNCDSTNALATAGTVIAIASAAPLDVFADCSALVGKVISMTQTSTGFRIHGRITATDATSAGRPINLENNGVNTCVLTSSCVLISSATSYGVHNDTNATPQFVTNYGAVSNRVLDPGLASETVKTVLIDSNVI